MSAAFATLNIGVIGLGRAATSMLPSLAAHPGVRVTAGCDVRPEAREAFARQFGAEPYAEPEQLCASSNVDAVYIASPHQWHSPHVVIAAAHGKHAIVEKPMALTLADCDTMLDAVDRAGVALLVGHTHSYDPPILVMRELIHSGAFGAVRMINSWNYTDFLYRPRRPEELDTALGGGIIFNQVPHQIDIVRLLGGGLVQSVRSMTGVWDPARPTEGSQATFLQFGDGAAATVVYSGYDHFSTDEYFESIGEGGQQVRTDAPGSARRALASVSDPRAEAAIKAATGVGGARQRFARGGIQPQFHPHFGMTLVSCDHADLRPSPRGVDIFSAEGRRSVDVPLGRTAPDKGRVVDEFYAAVVNGRPVQHDGRWGKATLEVCLAMLESSRIRREVCLHHQVPWRD